MERIRFSAVLITAVAALSMTITCSLTGCNNEANEPAAVATTAAVKTTPEYRMLYGSSPAERVQALTETEDFTAKTAALKKAAEKSGFSLTVSAEETGLTYTYTALESHKNTELQTFLDKITESESSFKSLAAEIRNELLVPNAMVKVEVVPVNSKTTAFEKTFLPDDQKASGYSGNNSATEPTAEAKQSKAKDSTTEPKPTEPATTERATESKSDTEPPAEEIVGDDIDIPMPE